MGYKGQTDKKIGRIAAAQSGVFSFAQALGEGVSKGAIGDRVAGQGLFRVYRGAYSLTRRVSQEGIWWAGVLSAGEESALSHMSALRLWGITTWVGPTEVIRPGSYGRKSALDRSKTDSERSALTETGRPIPVLRVRSTRSIHPSEVTTCDGIPVTTVARAFVDVCGSIGKGQLKKLLHEASREGKLNFAEVRATMDRARGKKGVGQLREIIDDWDPQTAWTRNEMEKLVLSLLRKHGQPKPLVNRIVAGHRADFFYPDCGLIIESDGGQDHNAPHGVERDKELDSDLHLKGFRILRLTRAMLQREPEKSMMKVKQHRELCLAEGRMADPGWQTASIGHRVGGGESAWSDRDEVRPSF